jgi:hypothetical protein
VLAAALAPVIEHYLTAPDIGRPPDAG